MADGRCQAEARHFASGDRVAGRVGGGGILRLQPLQLVGRDVAAVALAAGAAGDPAA